MKGELDLSCLLQILGSGLTHSVCLINTDSWVHFKAMLTSSAGSLFPQKKVPFPPHFLVPFAGTIHEIPNLVLSTHLPFNYCCNVAVSKGKKHFMK